MRKRVLFVCTANSARSLMAEALLRHMAGDRFDVASAGTEPTRPHPLALQVLSESGIAAEGLRSQSLEEVRDSEWDYVITLCEKAASECGSVHPGAQQIAWDFPDPVPSNRHAAFELTLKEIRERLKLFILVHQKETGRKPANYDPVSVFRALSDGFRLAALMLIRSQGELCVCELTEAFDLPQPKVSRHLASLRDAGLLQTERRGQWVYYSLHAQMPDWVHRILTETADNHAAMIDQPTQRLQAMADRPAVRCS